MQILSYIAGLGNLICLIMVVIKMKQKEGIVKAILGFICAIYAFIWGWMNSALAGKNIMIAWTVLILLGIVAGAMGGMATVSSITGGH